MGRQPRTLKPDSKPEESFANLMLAAAEFVSNCGGVEPAKRALTSAGLLIMKAEGISEAIKAIEVIERLKVKIDNPTNPPAAVAPDVPK